MEIILVKEFETKKFGKVAHFIDNDKDVYSKVIDHEGTRFYEALSKNETKELLEELESEFDKSILDEDV